jgi:hypothetical protein
MTNSIKAINKKAIIEAGKDGGRYYLDLGSEFSTYLIHMANDEYILTSQERDTGEHTGSFYYVSIDSLKADLRELQGAINE